ncbi:hypothetical protein EB155_06735 [archaeon]|nr:hypothetical protein [archaeon]
MAFQPINRGAQPNDNTGDNLREGAKKINLNFTEIYNALSDTNSSVIKFNYKNYKLGEVSDVTVPLPSHEYVLSWDTMTSKWIAVEKLSGNVVGHMIPTSNNMYDLGDANNNFRDVYVAGNTFFNPGEQRLFSDMGTLKVQYDYQTSNAVLFDSNTSTAASVTVLNPSQDIVFTDTTKLDSVTFGGTTIYYFPGIDTSIGPPYGLMPNVTVELTLEDTGAGTSNTYTNYDYTAYSTAQNLHNDAFYFSGRQTLTVENGGLTAGDGKIEADLLYADKATLVIKRTSSDGIGDVIISNKTQTLLNKTIPAANNTILMSITNLIDVRANTANIMSGDILQWSNTANAFTAMSPSLHPIAGPVSGSLVPTSDSAFDLGSSTSKFKDLYLSGTTLHLGSSTIKSTGSTIEFSNPIKLGNGTGDVPVQANLIPTTDSLFNLGSPSNKFHSLYLANSTIYLGDAALSVTSDGLAFIEEPKKMVSIEERNVFTFNPNIDIIPVDLNSYNPTITQSRIYAIEGLSTANTDPAQGFDIGSYEYQGFGFRLSPNYPLVLDTPIPYTAKLNIYSFADYNNPVLSYDYLPEATGNTVNYTWDNVNNEFICEWSRLAEAYVDNARESIPGNYIFSIPFRERANVPVFDHVLGNMKDLPPWLVNSSGSKGGVVKSYMYKSCRFSENF